MTKHRAARIIFVEDRPEHIALAKQALESDRIANEIQFFNTGESAKAYLDVNQGTPPDLILIDRNLENGDMQGDALAEYMINTPAFSQTEICIMSAAYPEKEKENEYARSPIKFFLKKPLITDQLDALIRSSARLRKLIIVDEDISVAA